MNKNIGLLKISYVMLAIYAGVTSAVHAENLAVIAGPPTTFTVVNNTNVPLSFKEFTPSWGVDFGNYQKLLSRPDVIAAMDSGQFVAQESYVPGSLGWAGARVVYSAIADRHFITCNFFVAFELKNGAYFLNQSGAHCDKPFVASLKGTTFTVTGAN